MHKSEELQIAIEAAKVGAKCALEYYEKPIVFDKKGDNSIISIADKNTEEKVKKFLLSQDKNAEFLAEESGGNKDKDRLWIIDPIDGSRCYSRGIPFWCVLVSLYEQGEIKLTTCYFPVIHSGLYYGEKGKGAFNEDKKMHVSEVPLFEDAYFTFGSLRHFKNRDQLMRLVDRTHGIRGYEPTYSSCLVAQGKVDVNVDVYAYAWDSAPFKVMVEEAGGKVTHPDGSPWSIEGRGIIATNGILHDEVLMLYNF